MNSNTMGTLSFFLMYVTLMYRTWPMWFYPHHGTVWTIKNLGHLPRKSSACGLTAGEKFHRSCGKQSMKIYCGTAAAFGRENVPCKVRAAENISCLWQMWCAGSEALIKLWQPARGSRVSDGGGPAEPHPNGIWGKKERGEKTMKGMFMVLEWFCLHLF